MCSEKQLLFAMIYVAVGNATEAYRQSYAVGDMTSHTIRQNAYRLTKNPSVRNKIIELRKEHAARHAITIDTMLVEIDDAIDLATALNKPSALATALALKAKLFGLVIDKTNISGMPEPVPATILFGEIKYDERNHTAPES